MPIYEYVCKDCKAHFEVLTTASSTAQTIKCKKCSSLNVKKTISTTSFRVSHGGSSIPTGALSGCSSKSGFS
ncbi:zinc ribbon domain protein [bacterium BMS3Bbin14]|nr:zinc ribbon domain protein [bacterium BMS3Abin13]GBE53304.1 zinc ribbon domain protein [bacterium BMS3Bbin14]HDK44293.1 zinc ribbon domain-containing protein [Desulfobacteraceae bacterium]